MTLGELYEKLKELEAAEAELQRQAYLRSIGESSEINLQIAQEEFDRLSEQEISNEVKL
jgi:hypothetical protein